MRSGCASVCSTVLRGLSESNGSWKIIWISRRYGRTWHPLVLSSRSASRNRIDPAVGRLRPRTDLASVVLPQPLSPTTATISPASTCKSTPSTACTKPRGAPNQPAPTEKRTSSPQISRSGGTTGLLVEPAARPGSRRDGEIGRRLDRAPGQLLDAARMKAAAGRRCDQIGRLTFNGLQHLNTLVGRERRTQQRPRIGMARPGEDAADITLLDDLAC